VTGKPTSETLFTPERVDAWVRGAITLRELNALSGEQLQEIARQAYRWLEEGRLDDARTAFEGLVALEPRESYFWSALAAVHLGRKDYGYAERCCSFALALNPKDQAAWVNRAEVSIRRGTLTDAVQNLQAALQLDPNPKNPITARAKLLIQSVITSIQRASPKAAAKKPPAPPVPPRKPR
jgi:predicted Zn-dependent protease